MPASPRSRRSWPSKFAAAFAGIKLGVRGQSSFFVHLLAATMVVVSALVLGVSRIEWCLLLLCITGVLAAEMFNSALEWLARAITDRDNDHLRGALDIASGAVLTFALGAAVVGLTVFLGRLGSILGWWDGLG